MSKAKLIELIKMNDHDLEYAIADFTLPEGGLAAFRVVLTQALKEQDRDTRQGCAEKITSMYPFIWEANALIDQYQASSCCMNYQDKDLKAL